MIERVIIFLIKLLEDTKGLCIVIKTIINPQLLIIIITPTEIRMQGNRILKTIYIKELVLEVRMRIITPNTKRINKLGTQILQDMEVIKRSLLKKIRIRNFRKDFHLLKLKSLKIKIGNQVLVMIINSKKCTKQRWRSRLLKNLNSKIELRKKNKSKLRIQKKSLERKMIQIAIN